MDSIEAVIEENGLFMRRRDLRAHGFSDVRIRRALHAGRIIRVRQGHYSIPSAPADAIKAVRVGGRLTGISALKSYGHWSPRTDRLHVVVPSDARGLRSETDMRARRPRFDEEEDGEKDASTRAGIGANGVERAVGADSPVGVGKGKKKKWTKKKKRCAVSWTDDARLNRSPSPWRVSVVDALVHVLCTADRTTAIVCLDAALNAQNETQRKRGNREGITEADLDAIFARAPARVQAWRADVDGRAQSGYETEFRLSCKEEGIAFVPQGAVPGVGHHDGQIGPHCFVEINSVAHHLNRKQFELDHERQSVSAVWGNRVLSFTNKLIAEQWALCVGAMRQAIAEDAALSKTTEIWRATPSQPDRARSVAQNVRRFAGRRHSGSRQPSGLSRAVPA